MGMQLSFSGKMHYICNRKTIKTENMNHVTAHTIYRYFPSGVQPFNWGGYICALTSIRTIFIHEAFR